MKRTIVTDVVVAGGGTAGCAAAIAAARQGFRVLLVEESNCLGGVSTSGGVAEWFASLDGLGDIFEQVRTELGHYGARFGQFFNPEYLKIVWQLMVEAAGVDILFHASVAGATVTDRRVTGVTVVSLSQSIQVEAQYFIDATGEGDLAALAGAAFEQGDPQGGRTLHMSLTAVLLDTGQPVTPYLPPGLEPIERLEDWPGLHTYHRLPDGRVYCNMTKVMEHDPTDPFSLSAAEREARRQLARTVHYLQRHQYATYTLASSGSRIGIREGRRITGEYVLTEADITSGTTRDFPDGVAVATCQIDFHSLTEAGDGGRRQRVAPYALPLRSLIARGWANLLMAGKCASGDQVAQSSFRMTPTCCAMGQAAGSAVGLALAQAAADIRAVDVQRLRGMLAQAGMVLDPARHQAYAP
ncbi:MAG: FAD-dependent oxidoreductase [Anaerolineae bacterium]|nr:FAD-dependent oxidoreductase [Anaerolineae bacterium]